MRRISLPRRSDFASRAAEIGFDYATIDGDPYWDESAAYEFNLHEIEAGLEAPSEELAAMCFDMLPRIIGSESLLRRLAIPQPAWDKIARSWKQGHASLYGRFDLVFDGLSNAKLLEYNADTPTSLFETAVVQWQWMQDLVARKQLPGDCDQFNSVHEKLIARWRDIGKGRFLHLAGETESIEDYGNLAYLNDCAVQAGLPTKLIDMADIGLLDQQFVDRDGRKIDFLFKLYPWEWLLADSFGSSPAMAQTQFVEPAWKFILSNKGFLALLWEAHRGHPNLLPCAFENELNADEIGERYARKPLFSREGANVTLMDGISTLAKNSGIYGKEGYVRQMLNPLPDFNGRHPVIGSWIIGDKAAGIGIREDAGLITSNRSCFVPHIIVD